MFSVRFAALILFFIVSTLLDASDGCTAYTSSQLSRFQSRIIDYGHKLNPKFKKKVRPRTDLIIVHTSELGLEATLRVVSRGKRMKSGRTTPGGHANYVIARNGRTYRILNRKYRADHAGRSMWNGDADISSVSVGVELVGYHYAPVTSAQYRSLGLLVDILKRVYRLDDKDILTHSQVAYGGPNRWFKHDHRGRKRCAKNFERAKAGLGPTWGYDPDVRAGRLTSDPILASVFYPKKKITVAQVRQPVSSIHDSNIISKENSAWAIAGDDYNDAATAYILPGGRVLPGNRIGSVIGWGRVPPGTRVLLNQDTETLSSQVKTPIKEISGRMTAWSHAGPAYRSDTTIYLLPSGKMSPGSLIRDWDDLPPGTKLVVGYKGPFTITRERTAFKIAGHHYRHRSVVYHLPGGKLVPGDKISDFNDLPVGVQLYLPLSDDG